MVLSRRRRCRHACSALCPDREKLRAGDHLVVHGDEPETLCRLDVWPSQAHPRRAGKSRQDAQVPGPSPAALASEGGSYLLWHDAVSAPPDSFIRFAFSVLFPGCYDSLHEAFGSGPPYMVAPPIWTAATT